ncbi:hypothetical protein SAMN05660420_03313 [Desulfuromusa kysingii]|uniref:Uncharacterized protein n=1 Tax=Desulfuromusa kysingii TaxID=37625 RepID=A0A1H4EC20_9BACT|nr:hypothetical protein SAMN05660420_03313 [Desulfuromusa kysingii]
MSLMINGALLVPDNSDYGPVMTTDDMTLLGKICRVFDLLKCKIYKILPIENLKDI